MTSSLWIFQSKFLLLQSFNSCLKQVQCILLQRWQKRYSTLHYHTWSQYIPCSLLCQGVQLDVSLQVLQWWPKIVIHRDKLLGASRNQLSCQQEKMKHIFSKRHFCLLPQLYATQGAAISFTSEYSVLQWQHKISANGVICLTECWRTRL